jgi:hypothetical protein
MLRLIGFFIKVMVFSLTVIVLSNWVHWRGRTISDNVRLQLSHAERLPVVQKLPNDVRNWVEKRAHAVRNGHWDSSAREQAGAIAQQATTLRPRASLASDEEGSSAGQQETLPASERQKLKNLIRELNGVQN